MKEGAQMVEIPFPLKRERYLDLGQEAMNSGKIQQASDYFKEAYACQKDFPLNFLLVSTLLELKKCDEALAVAEEFLPDYEKHLDFLGLYLQCLLETENFRRPSNSQPKTIKHLRHSAKKNYGL